MNDIKNEFKNKLNQLSKEEIVDIITDFWVKLKQDSEYKLEKYNVDVDSFDYGYNDIMNAKGKTEFSISILLNNIIDCQIEHKKH